MHKRITILSIRGDRYDPESLTDELISRRLARQRRRMASSERVQKWTASCVAAWKMSGGEADRLPYYGAQEPTADDYPHYPTRVSAAEREKILARVTSRFGEGSRAELSSKLKTAERDELIAAASGMRAVFLTEHEIDVAFAGVHQEFPWLASVTDKAWRQALRRSRAGLPAGVGPLLLLGPPGIGKSMWSRAVARALGLPSINIDVGTTGGVFDLQGTAKGWSSADRGRIMSTIIGERLANPVVVLDEIDAGGQQADAKSGTLPGLHRIMMGMIEPSTAAAWVCPYFQVPVDLRNLSWICTSNSISRIDQPLLDRMSVVELPNLTRQQLLAFATQEAAARFCDDAFVGVVVDKISDSLRRGSRLSLRHVTRILDRVEAASERPILH